MVRSFNNLQAGKMMPLTMVQVYKKGGTNQNKSMLMLMMPVTYLYLYIYIYKYQVYKKGGTNQNKSMEMTYEQIQKELGLGVQIE